MLRLPACAFGRALRRRFCAIICSALACAQAGELKDGDIVFQRSRSHQSEAISAATHSDCTHLGIVFFESGKPFVYEAIQPVVRTLLEEWAARDKGGHYVAKRLKEGSKFDSDVLKRHVIAMMGKDYDWLFEWSDDRMYCSELVWKAYRNAAGLELGKLRALGDFDLDHEGARRLMEQRYGSKVPLEMSVISPADIFASDLLVTVAEK